MKVTVVPSHTGLPEPDIETLTGSSGFSIIIALPDIIEVPEPFVPVTVYVPANCGPKSIASPVPLTTGDWATPSLNNVYTTPASDPSSPTARPVLPWQYEPPPVMLKTKGF